MILELKIKLVRAKINRAAKKGKFPKNYRKLVRKLAKLENK